MDEGRIAQVGAFGDDGMTKSNQAWTRWIRELGKTVLNLSIDDIFDMVCSMGVIIARASSST